MTYRFTVPGPPVPKGRPRFATKDRRGRTLARPRTYTPAATKAYERRVWSYAVAARVRPLAGDVWVSARFYYAGGDPPDTDNLLKAVLDALIGQGYRDDQQIAWLRDVRRCRDDANPRAEIELGDLTDGGAGCKATAATSGNAKLK